MADPGQSLESLYFTHGAPEPRKGRGGSISGLVSWLSPRLTTPAHPALKIAVLTPILGVKE